jgi:adenylyltransferase/sulfurtransferase
MKSSESLPPSVPADLARYSRQVILPRLGVEGQRRLAAARVLVMGVGALGGALASSMVRAGVGFVRLVDRDDFPRLSRPLASLRGPTAPSGSRL